MKEEGVKGSEKVGKKLDLFCAQFCPLVPMRVCPLDVTLSQIM